MANDFLDSTSLLEEYQTLVDEAGGAANPDWQVLNQKLTDLSEWTQFGAEHLVAVARNYGSFFLRNALALAVALEREDGELGI